MELRERLRIAPGSAVDLGAIDPAGTPGAPKKADKKWTAAQFADVGAALGRYQEMLYAGAKAAGSRQRVLLVLQAMDCGGKDGTVRRVAGAMNPQGLQIASFGRPTDEERRHDFLWR